MSPQGSELGLVRRGVSVGVAAARLTRGRAAKGGVVLGYHDVVGARAEGFAVTAADLRRHIRLLRRLGFHLAGIGELVETLGRRASTDGLAVLTFDDGLVGVHEHAVEVLAEEGAPGTLCAVSGAWGQPPRWWPGARRVMTRREVGDVIAAGWEIAAHTRTHPSLPSLTDAALVQELQGCRADLEDLVNVPVTALAYPDGHHDGRVRAAARAAGYRLGFTFLNGRLTGDEDPWRLPRLTMGAKHTSGRLGYHLARSPGSWPEHQAAAIGPVPTA